MHDASKTLDGEGIDAAIAVAEQVIGYTFKDKKLLEEAITHPSATQGEGWPANYERMEFLGDSILGAVVASELYKRFPDLDEGGLSRIKVSLVSGTMLSEVALEAGLDRAIIFGTSETGTGARGLHSALENVYEAVVAALYLDGGLDAARAWIEPTLFGRISRDVAEKPDNPKGELQEYLQSKQKHPVYSIVGTDGPPHDRTFHAQVAVEGEVLGSGDGHSKKDAETCAAAAALESLDQ